MTSNGLTGNALNYLFLEGAKTVIPNQAQKQKHAERRKIEQMLEDMALYESIEAELKRIGG